MSLARSNTISIGAWILVSILIRATQASTVAEALFLPRVGVVVVAVPLPEAELVVVEELEPPDPLGALPEVALRDQEAERVAVLELERLAAERVGEHHVVIVEHRQRQVRGVPLLGVGHDVRRVRTHLRGAEDLLDRDAFPDRVEL